MTVSVKPCTKVGWVAIFLVIGLAWPQATLSQEDEKGLLPPPGSDRSRRVAEIRKALSAGETTLALQKADELARREPRNLEGPFWQGFVHMQRHDLYAAIRALRRAEALSPNPFVLKLLAVSYYGAHQRRLFLLKINEALRLQPDDFAPHYYLGRYYDSDLSDFRRAAEHFAQAIARNPSHFRSHYYLGYCHEVDQKPDAAEREYRRSIELAEHQHAAYAMPYQGLARLRLAANKLEEALAFAQRALELDPRDAAGHKLLARTWSELGRDAEAAAEWEASAALDPTDAPSLYRLYRVYVALGQTDKADSALARYKKIAALYGTN